MDYEGPDGSFNVAQYWQERPDATAALSLDLIMIENDFAAKHLRIPADFFP